MNIIRNKRQLAATAARKTILDIAEAGFTSIQLQNVLARQISRTDNALRIQNEIVDLSQFKNVAVAGIGKCALAAAKRLEKILGNRITAGIVLDVKQENLRRIQSVRGTHPLPSLGNMRASAKMLCFMQSLDPATDVLIFIASGGGSSLFFLPDGIAARDMVALTNDLHKSGANIKELNCVRKHLSYVQGGKLAKLLHPLPVIALFFSDVVAKTETEMLRTIASGPLYPDNETSAKAKAILKKYDLWDTYKGKIKRWSGTVKDKRSFSNVRRFLVLTNRVALDAMARAARKKRLKPYVLDAAFAAPARTAFVRLKAMARRHPGYDVYLAAGEMTVQVTGAGTGGRNQEAALAALPLLRPDETFASVASDGIDNTAHAGALADATGYAKAKAKNLDVRDYLARNDSFDFFRKTGDFIRTGSTGSNVSDILVYMRKRAAKK